MLHGVKRSQRELLSAFRVMTRYAAVLTHSALIIPASYFFEVPFASSLLSAVASVGLLQYASSTENLEEYSREKTGEYRDEPQLFLYSDRSQRVVPHHRAIWRARTVRSASQDITTRWRAELEQPSGVWPGILAAVERKLAPDVLELELAAAPDRLDGRAFLYRFVEAHLPFRPTPRARYSINTLINQAYLNSYLAEYAARILVDTPLGPLDCGLPRDDRLISYERWRSLFTDFRYHALIAKELSWAGLVRLRSTLQWRWFLSLLSRDDDDLLTALRLLDTVRRNRNPSPSSEFELVDELSALRDIYRPLHAQFDLRFLSAPVGSQLELGDPQRTRALARLLVDMFTNSEFTRFLRATPRGAELCASLLGDEHPRIEYMDHAVDLLTRCGCLDHAFFDDLARERTGRTADIEHVKRLYV